MTLDEAKKVAFIIGHADSACSTCVGTLIDLCNEQFPEFEFEMGDAVDSEYDDDGDCLASRIDVLVKVRG